MTEQAARITKTCGNCKSQAEGWAVQLTRNKRLRWELEWACNGCGVWRDGDWGPAPDYVRDPILKQHGHYRLRISSESPPGGKTLKAFRDTLGVTLKQARDSALEATAQGFLGTYVEVALIHDLLRDSGIESTVTSEKE